MNIWIEKTIVKGRKDRLEGERAFTKAIWSPRFGKDGRDTYKNMRKVNKDDFIIHFIDNKKFAGISKVESSLEEVDGMESTDWNRDSYVFKLVDFKSFNLLREELLNEQNKSDLLKILNNSEVFFQSNLNLRQGAYLTPCKIDLLLLINKIYHKMNKKNIPFFEEMIADHDIDNLQQHVEKKFKLFDFAESCRVSGLIFSELMLSRVLASLLTKPFVILSGLSGSGKTKLAQAFAQWICQDKSQYRIIPVGADWTNKEFLLGYPNALKPDEYVKPDNGVIDLIIQANLNPKLPHFLILDEMNLSHVERYFADFLSVMESNEEIPLYAESTMDKGVPSKLKVPANLFTIGTVNIDETTNMFSPKVLDRANTIEFRVSQNEMETFLNRMGTIDMDLLVSKGADMSESFMEMATNEKFYTTDSEHINSELLKFFGELKKTGAEFGYRSASEIMRLINQLTILDNSLETAQKIDIAIMQKLLPKLHGSRRKLCPVLLILGSFCVEQQVISNIEKDVFLKENFNFDTDGVIYPISLEKISRMYNGAIENGFASYAEA